MAQDYKITQVSQQPPKEWANPKGGTVYYIKCMVEGHKRPVDIGKKSPDALKVGDIVYGDIIPTDLLTDKFKSVQRQQGYGSGGGKPAQTPRDDAAIQAQFAIKAAVQALGEFNKGDDYEDYFNSVEDAATKLYAMIDRVKASK